MADLGSSVTTGPAATTTAATAGPGLLMHHHRQTSSHPLHHQHLLSSTPQGRKRRTSDSTEDLIMDDCSAAMVLMSLSCSPKSPLFATNFHARERAKYSNSWTSGTSTDSGFPFDSPASSGAIRSTTPSPPTAKKTATGAGMSLLSRPAQQTQAQSLLEDHLATASQSSPSSSSSEFEGHNDPDSESDQRRSDEGVDLQEEETTMSLESKPRKLVPRKRIIFVCTFPGCDARYRQTSGMERHVRQQHSVEAGEEDFYFTEMETTVRRSEQRVSPSTASMDGSVCSLSPVASPGPQATSFRFGTMASMPTWSHLDMARPAHEDPEYQRSLKQQKSGPIAIPGMSFTHDAAFASTPKSGHKFMRVMGSGLKVSPGTSLLAPSLASPKSRVGRSRGDTRKCRKVYGMESRDLWCTQCKWKKACTRFHD